ncbi:MAG: HAMP domain-containing sensor histidine kinase [Paramuribaculum sp.]|nr:HAMP domain-containing sensor histidine kinase [Paramuribaculum sp.]
MNVPSISRHGKILFLIASIIIVAAFLLFSNSLAKGVAEQERIRMQIWADATRQIASAETSTGSDASGSNLDFLLEIIETNTSIPVILTDDAGKILMQRNFDLPETAVGSDSLHISPANAIFLAGKLDELRRTGHVIHIMISPSTLQHLYYQDSRLLRALNIYPYIMIAMMAAFVAIVYFAVSSSKQAEQNMVWVGLSKETAHQLGTPISSLMAWIEILRESGTDSEITEEMDKDVRRLETIASRFSKIGSQPVMELADLREVVSTAADYMLTRISSNIALQVNLPAGAAMANVSPPLLQWVMENLIKNAVDAMDGRGRIAIEMTKLNGTAIITVTDTGRGIPHKDFKRVFRPGHTTKQRGWGLGLTLARRIIEQYHGGRIFVSSSSPGIATTFEINIPLQKS